ncbi:AhpD family alkylhydroperoxidase [Paraburkholderia silvatlantica]|uniref:AhpD family alkylhydroperoxidase n=1 Tax=Paraburkholderia silvatlantica TaxID=321895 RepID=A0ABR6FK98_9BURK|nr:AhpD family alkylhydroperoxidase [Paraburkholderia silvatlantica]PVY27588.1 AhpD family alkylhydroperoxidase [Paraburkholderia silvatlantica]PXW34561.1 AhpD family alkylhydroperoxidase [Paraburkholderia silvatlantica]
MGTPLAVSGSLEPSLIALVEVRASQINGYANRLDMHTAYACEEGGTE